VSGFIHVLCLALLGTTVFRGMQNFELSRGICQLPRNFCFCGILRNSVLPVIRGQIRHILVVFRWPYVIFAMKYIIHDCQWGRNGRNVETIDLSLSEILQVYLVDNCISQLQLLATNTVHLFWLMGP